MRLIGTFPIPDLIEGRSRLKIKTGIMVNGQPTQVRRLVDLFIDVYKGEQGQFCHSCWRQTGIRVRIQRGEIHGHDLFFNCFCYDCIVVPNVPKNRIIAKRVFYKPKRKSIYTKNGANHQYFVGTKKMLKEYCATLEAAGYPVLYVKYFE